MANILNIFAKLATAPGPISCSKTRGVGEHTFNAQGASNTLWVYAKMGRVPGVGVMRELEGRAEALAGTFNAQEVEGRAESLAGTFNAQEVANTAENPPRRTKGAQRSHPLQVHYVL